jgi:hypothetical protein
MMYITSHVYFGVRIEIEVSPQVLLCELGDYSISELLRRGLAAKVTRDGLALRNRLSTRNG